MTEIALKTCKTCHAMLPTREFHKQKSASDGLKSSCKLCRNTILKSYYQTNKQKRLLYAKSARGKSGYREKQSAYHTEYRKRSEYSEQQRKSQETYKTKNRVKIKARYTLNNAISRDEIVRPEICSNCNKSIDVEGHHFDYMKPLDVIWLCKDCHSLEHVND